MCHISRSSAKLHLLTPDTTRNRISNPQLHTLIVLYPPPSPPPPRVPFKHVITFLIADVFSQLGHEAI